MTISKIIKAFRYAAGCTLIRLQALTASRRTVSASLTQNRLNQDSSDYTIALSNSLIPEIRKILVQTK